MGKNSYIKCYKCGVFNTDREYCKNCGTLISYKKKKEIEVEKFRQKEIEQKKQEIKNSYVEKLKKHPFFLFRFLGWVLYSVWSVVTAIGMFIAWLIATMAA